MSSFAFRSQENSGILKAALCEPTSAIKAWQELCSEVPFMDLGNDSIRLFPAIYRNLSNSAPEEIGRLRGSYRKNWVQNQLAWSSYVPLFQAFAKAEVCYVIGKGFAVAVLLGDLGIRRMGDIDIYALKKDSSKILEILACEGFTEKYSRSCPHDYIAFSKDIAGSYLNDKGHEIDLHLVDSGSDYLHRKMVSTGYLTLAFGRDYCRIPQIELTLIKSVRHGMKQIATSDFIQSAWDTARLLSRCDSKELQHHLRKSGDAFAFSQIVQFLHDVVQLPLLSLDINSSRRAPVRKLRNFQYELIRRIRRIENPWLFLRIMNQVSNKGFVWAIWRSLGSPRPFERIFWKYFGGFVSKPEVLLFTGETQQLKNSGDVLVNKPKGAGEIRFRFRSSSEVKQIQFFNIEQLTSSWQIFINGILHGSIPIHGSEQYFYNLESPDSEISLRNQSNRCDSCAFLTEELRFKVS